MSLQQVFRNHIEIRIVIKRENTGEETIIVANPNFTSAENMLATNIFYPAIMMQSSNDESSETIELTMIILGNCPKYQSDSKYATTNDSIEEVTFTFIPNNTFVEVDKDENSV